MGNILVILTIIIIISMVLRLSIKIALNCKKNTKNKILIVVLALCAIVAILSISQYIMIGETKTFFEIIKHSVPSILGFVFCFSLVFLYVKHEDWI